MNGRREEIEEAKLVKKFLKCLPRKKYIPIVAALEQVLDLKTTRFKDIIGRLKAYEEHVFDEEDNQDDQGKLMYANMQTEQAHDYNNNNRGRDRLLKLQATQENESIETQEADELMMHEVVYLNEGKIIPSNYEVKDGEEDIWYLDNEASNHMSGDCRYFSSIDDSISGKVRFGDDSCIDIKGKGSIEFMDRNGEARKITYVDFIPNLKSNIISLGKVTESGCDIRMRGEHPIMHDQDGKLIAKALRSKNRLYKHELVTGIPQFEIEKKVCGSCLMGK
ncbi:uncharacterized protein LOC106355047 [Brassica napus]|uniref:uncharacterized protein LOC106355047 n=1 Tax=Brassica napus TaxID=3708 RepID=UPI0006AA7876|nr:uncharacterized protein LOC106355047 [Brassica napus]